MRIKLNKHGLFSQRWGWTKLEVNTVLNELNYCGRPILHVCSGSSGIGDVKLDRVLVNEKTLHAGGYQKYLGHANILGNMLELPFKDSVFPTVICDPPYDYSWYENGIYQKLVDEIVRVTKKDGKILYYAPSVFTHISMDLIKTEYTQMGKRCYYKILSVSKKKQHQITDYN